MLQICRVAQLPMDIQGTVSFYLVALLLPTVLSSSALQKLDW